MPRIFDFSPLNVSVLLFFLPVFLLVSNGHAFGMLPEATTQEKLEDPFSRQSQNADIEIYDPLEEVNRTFFTFNKVYYFYGLKPVSKGYREITSSGTRKHVRNFFRNIKEPLTIVNSLLQGELDDASTSSKRFFVNTIFGGGGFFDPAGKYHPRVVRDFDQTFSKWGIGHGIYILWPMIGPSSVRGTGSYALNESMNPFYWTGEIDVTAGGIAFDTISWTAAEGQSYEQILRHSVDGYSSLKNIYEQRDYKRTRE